MKHFQAKYVTYQNEGSVVMVGFADHEFDTNQYVLLQRELMPDDQDEGLDLQKIFIQIDSPLQSAYGGIQSIDLSTSSVLINIDMLTSQKLNVSQVEVDFSQAACDYQKLRDHLEALVGDEEILKYT